MENLYKVLQVDANSATEDIRKAYIRLAKLHHPDKNKECEASSQGENGTPIDNNSGINGSQVFVKINHAWKVLSNPALRAEFDIKWKQRCLNQTFPIQDNVAFCDFDFCEEDGTFVYPCRCGSDYVLSESEAELFYDIVCCETCSLTIQVEYDI